MKYYRRNPEYSLETILNMLDIKKKPIKYYSVHFCDLKVSTDKIDSRDKLAKLLTERADEVASVGVTFADEDYLEIGVNGGGWLRLTRDKACLITHEEDCEVWDLFLPRQTQKI